MGFENKWQYIAILLAIFLVLYLLIKLARKLHILHNWEGDGNGDYVITCKKCGEKRYWNIDRS